MSLSLRFRRYDLTKRVALMISRGSSAGSSSFVVELECDGVIGLGEAAEFEIPGHGETIERIESDLAKTASAVSTFHASQRFAIESHMRESGIGASVRAAVDMALHDWMGKPSASPYGNCSGLSVALEAPSR